MKKVIVSCIILTLLIAGGVYYFLVSQGTVLGIGTKTPYQSFRQTEEIPLDISRTDQPLANVPATKLPSFTIDLSQEKLRSLVAVTQEKLKDVVQATITHAYASGKLDADVSVDPVKNKLIIHPKDMPDFKPGMYRLSLKLRTMEGIVNVEQDFTWGVIAVNTNKSIYAPGETAKIGIGVLNDGGETQCLTGDNHVDGLDMIITDPAGKQTTLSIDDQTIQDSGKCGLNTVTNDADFKATYPTTTPGIYQMKVLATLNGHQREIEDYFKVDGTAAFDIERTSFPTRIYPMSPYPATFTVTAKQNFQGRIEDVVPGNFAIEHISDNGHIEKSGDFTKIVWNTALTANQPQTFTYFIVFPKVSPEFYLLGPISIGNFKEARQWQIASDAPNSTSGVVSYEDNAGSDTWSRVWTGTTWNPTLGSTATSMSQQPTDSRWFREVSSPKTGEKIVALVDNIAAPTGDKYYVFTWNGSTWTADKNFGLAQLNVDTSRAFDVAYEDNSGDALFVFSDYANAQLKYFKRVGGSWDSASSSAGVAFDTYKRWVRLRPQLGTDQILVGYLTNNNRVGAMIWDGATNTFGNQFDETTSSVTARNSEQGFDVAWQTANGTPMVFWEGGTFNNIIYRQFNTSSGDWDPESSGAAVFTSTADGVWLYAAADPVSTSNYISLAFQERPNGATNPTCRFGVWDGSKVVMNNNTVSCTSTGTAPTNNLVDTAFEYNGSKAMYVAVVSTASGQLSWLTWTPTSGFSRLTTEAGAVPTGAIEGIQLYSDLNTRTMMTLYHDNSNAANANDCQLWEREWDGSSWTALNANPIHARICSSADDDTEPYGFGFDRNLETQVAYRWFDNSPGTDASVDTALTTQNTAYTLTEQNQQFRLRMLLYYPDSLTAGLRTYKLQFVDPGTGTCANPTGGSPNNWTDVGDTVGTRAISYFNNGSVASASALIANGSLDPTYAGKTKVNETYNEQNTFTTTSSIAGDQVGLFDFSLVDNTAFDRTAQTYCFRVVRSNDLALQNAVYPQLRTASIPDVLIKGGTRIQGGTKLQ